MRGGTVRLDGERAGQAGFCVRRLTCRSLRERQVHECVHVARLESQYGAEFGGGGIDAPQLEQRDAEIVVRPRIPRRNRDRAAELPSASSVSPLFLYSNPRLLCASTLSSSRWMTAL